MSENFDELGELGDKIKKIIDTAVSTKDYRQMTEVGVLESVRVVMHNRGWHHKR